jgi:hypothetical protein
VREANPLHVHVVRPGQGVSPAGTRSKQETRASASVIDRANGTLKPNRPPL